MGLAVACGAMSIGTPSGTPRSETLFPPQLMPDASGLLGCHHHLLGTIFGLRRSKAIQLAPAHVGGKKMTCGFLKLETTILLGGFQ